VKSLRLMADYECHPLWDLEPGMYGDIDPETLPISEDLKRRLAGWAREFDETLNRDDPASSGFKSDEAEQAFKERGRQLAGQLQSELGSAYSISIKV